MEIWPAAVEEDKGGRRTAAGMMIRAYGGTSTLLPPFQKKRKKKHFKYTPNKTNLSLPPFLYRWYRPRATKKMTVELSRASGPFIWPDEPTDFSAWSKNVYDTSAREKEAEEKRMSPGAATLEKEDGAVLRTQAERLLRGEERWRGKWAVP